MRCRSFDEVMLALGGSRAVARITGTSKTAVSNWRVRNRLFPSKYYAVIAMALYDRGFYAPWGLFHFTGIDRDAA